MRTLKQNPHRVKWGFLFKTDLLIFVSSANLNHARLRVNFNKMLDIANHNCLSDSILSF